MHLKSKAKLSFVSHSIQQVEQICDRVAWMHYGDLRAFGETKHILKEYRAFLHRYNHFTEPQKESYQRDGKAKQRNFSFGTTSRNNS